MHGSCNWCMLAVICFRRGISNCTSPDKLWIADKEGDYLNLKISYAKKNLFIANVHEWLKYSNYWWQRFSVCNRFHFFLLGIRWESELSNHLLALVLNLRPANTECNALATWCCTCWHKADVNGTGTGIFVVYCFRCIFSLALNLKLIFFPGNIL
jgi:hypothetical protein